MEYGGMVHALEEIHRLLKPNGVLIDIHPVAESSPIEIHQGGKINQAGNLLVRQWCIDFQQADNALTEITKCGLFAVERVITFDSLTHYSSVAEMRTSLIEAIDKFAREDQSAGEAVTHVETLTARAEELMQAIVGEADLIVRERERISRYKPTWSG
jgi:hypothetical protein